MISLIKYLSILVLVLCALLTGCQPRFIPSGPATKTMYKCSYKNLTTKLYYYGENPDYQVAGEIAQRECMKGPSPTKCLMHYCEKTN